MNWTLARSGREQGRPSAANPADASGNPGGADRAADVPRATRPVGRWCALVMLTALALVALWPASLGGAAQFVVVRGTSMEPTYHSGDLLYARTTSRFRVGDVAVYRLADSTSRRTRFVVHRLQGRTADGRWITKGDNRPGEDGALPRPGDLVARPILNLGAIPAQMLLLLPWTMMLVVAITFGWYLWPHESGPEPSIAAPPRRRYPRPHPALTRVAAALCVGGLAVWSVGALRPAPGTTAAAPTAIPSGTIPATATIPTTTIPTTTIPTTTIPTTTIPTTTIPTTTGSPTTSGPVTVIDGLATPITWAPWPGDSTGPTSTAVAWDPNPEPVAWISGTPPTR